MREARKVRGAVVLVVLVTLGVVWAGKPAAKVETFTGKVVRLADVLNKEGVKLDVEAAPHWLALVTEAGWTISRSPILPIGIDPLRVKASSRSASYAAKVRP